ncbi:hypothetical protein BGX34_003571 [Mortierella sp. NVP85]|nr:hypothetical protein BGX34_003571 [Mortierella sp. NVP85]
MADYRSGVQTSTHPMVHKTATSVSPASASGDTVYSTHHRQQCQNDRLDVGTTLPLQRQQVHLTAGPTSHSQSDLTHPPFQVLLPRLDSGSSDPSSPDSITSPLFLLQGQEPNRFQSEDKSRSRQHGRFLPKSEKRDSCFVHLDNERDSRTGESKLVVRLDLRKLGVGTSDVLGAKKLASRRLSKPMSMDPAMTLSAQPNQSAKSQSANGTASEPPFLTNTHGRSADETPVHLYQTKEAAVPHCPPSDNVVSPPTLIQSSAVEGHTTRQSDSLDQSSVVMETPHRGATTGQPDMPNEAHSDSSTSRASSKSTPVRVLRGHVSKKRTSIPDEGASKKKRLEPSVSLPEQQQQDITVKKGLAKKVTNPLLLTKGVVSITGDELALQYNNDLCEACMGVGEFICCDSCPKVFHFSCCQPPMDPQDLPDEWWCNECRTKRNPPPPSSPGIFQQLLDNLNASNPKAFTLPEGILSFNEGVANNKGIQKEALDNTSTKSEDSTEDPAPNEALTLQRTYGDDRVCHRCDEGAVEDQKMLSCDYCPLHWHLDCLMSPMASPSNTHKWMCPNHPDLVPRRGKRRETVTVQTYDSNWRNNESTEVISGYGTTPRKRSIVETDANEVLCRIPERSIKLGFIDKCQRVRESKTGEQIWELALSNARASRSSDWGFKLLITAAMASEITSEATSLGETTHQEQEPSSEWSSQEKIQNAVLDRLTEPAERQEYLRFRAFQRYIREHGTEEAMNHWLDQQQSEKERIATQGLLAL